MIAIAITEMRSHAFSMALRYFLVSNLKFHLIIRNSECVLIQNCLSIRQPRFQESREKNKEVLSSKYSRSRTGE